jgi:DNA polymerase-3 subunit gamma/tau
MRLALYRKYRPQGFGELLGQNPVRDTLMQALKQERLSHAYLFSGPRGTGKTSSARLIAKSIQCESRLEDGQACSTCRICKMNEKGNLVDLLEVDAASNRGIDEIRELREKLRFAPSYATAKVYIIDEVHMLTKEAFNALLKSLEEPPPHVYFILATTEIHKIPETILSRCQRFDFRRISIASIVERLKMICEAEKFEYEEGALQLLARSANGGMRDAISLLEQFSNGPVKEEIIRDRLGLNHEQVCVDLYEALASSDTQAGIKLIDQLHEEGASLEQFALSFLTLLREKLHGELSAQKVGLARVLSWVEHFDAAWVKLKQASIAQLPLEIAVIRCTADLSGPVVVAQAAAPAMAAPVKAVVSAAPVEVKVEKKTVNSPLNERGGSVMNNKVVQAQATPRPVAQKAMVKTPAPAKVASGTINLSAVYKAIKTASVKHSFRTAELLSMDGMDITFGFSSRFHFDKANQGDALVEIEKAINDTHGQTYKLHLQVGGTADSTARVHKNIEATPAPQVAAPRVAPAPIVTAPVESFTKKDVDDLGWEVVEEPIE